MNFQTLVQDGADFDAKFDFGQFFGENLIALNSGSELWSPDCFTSPAEPHFRIRMTLVVHYTAAQWMWYL